MIYFQVFLSFALAGSWIAVLTLLAERFGSKVGGLITNLPSNILITLIFISLSQGIGFVEEMTPAIPIGLLIDSIFLVVFILLLRYNLLVGILGSIGSWLVLALIANRIQMESLWINVAIYFAITILAFLFVEYGWKIPAKGRSGKKYTLGQMAIRAAFAGGIVGGVVLISHFVPAYLTGIISAFPAVLFSSMVILAVNQGKAFAQATGKVMILSTSNIVIYTLGVYFTYPVLGIVGGTVVSFVIAFLWVVMLRPVMKRFT
ncbi:MAG: DUF3147 family protein [Bacteroidia bacterium]|nr:DUF3147 family protein [Bacteroidia bacterium]